MKPTPKQIEKFVMDVIVQGGFKDEKYINEWYDRFETPIKVWQMSGYGARQGLKNHFPEIFGNLDIKQDITNNSKYEDWDNFLTDIVTICWRNESGGLYGKCECNTSKQEIRDRLVFWLEDYNPPIGEGDTITFIEGVVDEEII